jgi:hypothetical protein
MKALILTPEAIECHYLHENLSREEALEAEKQIIMDLVSKGSVLANVQHNRHPLPSVADVVRSVKKGPLPRA